MWLLIFPCTRTPTGFWQYRYSATKSLDPAQFQLETYVETVGPTGFWHPAVNNGPGRVTTHTLRTIARTKRSSARAKGWAIRAGQVAMEASNSGQYSLIRFVAPAAGIYKITARFEGIHFGRSSTDVHVLHNAASLFAAEIEGYGGDPSYHQIQGSNPVAEYLGEIMSIPDDGDSDYGPPITITKSRR
jgi:hypothetical protein